MAHPKQPTDPRMIERARQLRRESTIPEHFLWSLLRGGGLAGLKFRRQHPIGPFVADFYCHDVARVVELDGMSHEGRAEADSQRTRYLEGQGMRVLRLTNDDVLNDREAVALAILKAAGVACQ
jgi:very-short-patch-repair endonuclease